MQIVIYTSFTSMNTDIIGTIYLEIWQLLQDYKKTS